jgi:formamidopyrimidine-DNA glycosylase
VLAGVGNIYADEALYLSRIRPTRPARRLSRADCARLVAAVKRVLRRSIVTGGSSISDYVQPDGSDGAYQDERRVYDRAGEPCLRCGARIRRIVIGQRSSHYCPRCQPR